MNEPQASTPHTIICLASYFKGGDFIREAKRLGFRVILLTKEKLLHEDWPRESLDDIVAVPNDAGTEIFMHVVGQLARTHNLARLVALEEYDVITAALIREHLCLPGMKSTEARIFRDKLSMRVRERIQQVGFVFLLLLMGFVIINDVTKFAPGLFRSKEKPAATQQK